MEKLPILIVGGGIGGLTTALALSRRNRPVHVVEKAPEFGEIGAGLQLAPNAMYVLEQVGVLPEISKHAVYPSRLVWMDAIRGTRITAVGWLTPLVLNHNYHAVHHIWPTVPWHRYREIYRNKLDYLTRNGVPIEHRVTFRPPEPARPHRESARAR